MGLLASSTNSADHRLRSGVLWFLVGAGIAGVYHVHVPALAFRFGGAGAAYTSALIVASQSCAMIFLGSSGWLVELYGWPRVLFFLGVLCTCAPFVRLPSGSHSQAEERAGLLMA